MTLYSDQQNLSDKHLLMTAERLFNHREIGPAMYFAHIAVLRAEKGTVNIPFYYVRASSVIEECDDIFSRELKIHLGYDPDLLGRKNRDALLRTHSLLYLGLTSLMADHRFKELQSRVI